MVIFFYMYTILWQFIKTGSEILLLKAKWDWLTHSQIFPFLHFQKIKQHRAGNAEARPHLAPKPDSDSPSLSAGQSLTQPLSRAEPHTAPQQGSAAHLDDTHVSWTQHGLVSVESHPYTEKEGLALWSVVCDSLSELTIEWMMSEWMSK